MRTLVLADIDRRIEKVFPNISFDFMGYATDSHIPSAHAEILQVIQDYDFLISEFDHIDREIIDKAHKLKMIICCRGGVHSVIDVKYATEKGIVVKNTQGRNANAVAEYVLGVILNNDRNLFVANQKVLTDELQRQNYILPENYRDSLWGMDSSSPYHRFRGKGLHNCILGVIGYGNVGRVVVNMAILLGIRVMVYDHNNLISLPSSVEVVDKRTLLQTADYISLHCNNRLKRVVIGENEFRIMKKGAFFINTARGDLVDECALIVALNSGHLSGAALDVTRQEPLPTNSPLIKAKNIFITPHIAGATEEVKQIGTDMSIYYLQDYISDIMSEV